MTSDNRGKRVGHPDPAKVKAERKTLRTIAWLILRGRHGRACRVWARAFGNTVKMLKTVEDRMDWSINTLRRGASPTEMKELDLFLMEMGIDATTRRVMQVAPEADVLEAFPDKTVPAEEEESNGSD